MTIDLERGDTVDFSVFLPAFLQARNMYFCQATRNAPVLLTAARRESIPHDCRVPSRTTDVLIAAIGPSTLQVPPTMSRLATFAGARSPPCTTRLSRTATPGQQSLQSRPPNRSRALAYCLRRSALISNGSPQTRRTKRTIHWAMCRDMGTVASTES